MMLLPYNYGVNTLPSPLPLPAYMQPTLSSLYARRTAILRTAPPPTPLQRKERMDLISNIEVQILRLENEEKLRRVQNPQDRRMTSEGMPSFPDEKDEKSAIQKFRPYARVIASGIEYADSKSIVKAIGALLFPYPYLVYRGYQSYKGKKK